jgi:hypothetical protein
MTFEFTGGVGKDPVSEARQQAPFAAFTGYPPGKKCIHIGYSLSGCQNVRLDLKRDLFSIPGAEDNPKIMQNKLFSCRGA